MERDPVRMRGEIEIQAENDDSKEDVTRPKPPMQRPRALESNAPGRFVAHRNYLILR